MRGKTDMHIYRISVNIPSSLPPPTHTHPHIYTRRAFDSYKPMFELVAGFEALHEQLAFDWNESNEDGKKGIFFCARKSCFVPLKRTVCSLSLSLSLSSSIYHSSFFSIPPPPSFPILSILFSLALIRKSD